MFATAKTIAPKTKTKAEKATVHINGLKRYAILVHLSKTFATMAELWGEKVRNQMTSHFVAEGCKTGKRPTNFMGTDGEASASCELRMRSSRSPLSIDEQVTAKDHDLPTEEIEDVVGTFVIAPAYATDMAMLAKIEMAHTAYNIGRPEAERIPDDLFMKQEAKTRVIISEKAMDELFTRPADIVRDLLPLVGTLAIKPKLEIANDMDMVGMVSTMLVEPSQIAA
jgi:hypothetical protein